MVAYNCRQGQEQHMSRQQEEQQMATQQQQQQDFQAGLQHLALQQQTASATPARLVHQQQHQPQPRLPQQQ